MNFPCRQFVSASVVILMALSSVAPLGYTHAHEATPCRQHDHAHADHAACHHHCTATHEERAHAALGSPHLHQHVIWWGLEFVRPAPPAGENHVPASDFDDAQLGVLASSDNDEAIDAAPAVSAVVLADMQSLGDAPDGSKLLRGPAPRCECNLLCDAARRARTGVLLV